MKTFVFAFAVLVFLPFQSVQAASPEEQARFLAAVRQAYDKQDTNALFALVCWDRVTRKDADSARKQFERILSGTKVADMVLVDPDPKLPKHEWTDKDGVSYRPNLPLIKQLKITYGPGALFHRGLLPVGEKDGRLYLSEPAPVENRSTAKTP